MTVEVDLEGVSLYRRGTEPQHQPHSRVQDRMNLYILTWMIPDYSARNLSMRKKLLDASSAVGVTYLFPPLVAQFIAHLVVSLPANRLEALSPPSLAD